MFMLLIDDDDMVFVSITWHKSSIAGVLVSANIFQTL